MSPGWQEGSVLRNAARGAQRSSRTAHWNLLLLRSPPHVSQMQLGTMTRRSAAGPRSAYETPLVSVIAPKGVVAQDVRRLSVDACCRDRSAPSHHAKEIRDDRDLFSSRLFGLPASVVLRVWKAGHLMMTRSTASSGSRTCPGSTSPSRGLLTWYDDQSRSGERERRHPRRQEIHAGYRPPRDLSV